MKKRRRERSRVRERKEKHFGQRKKKGEEGTKFLLVVCRIMYWIFMSVVVHERKRESGGGAFEGQVQRNRKGKVRKAMQHHSQHILDRQQK